MNALLGEDERFLWHPFTPHPPLGPRAVLSRAQGAYVYDDAGRAYFDATSSWWCNTHGHCHPRLVAALKRQAETMDQVLFAPHTHAPAVELAKGLLAKLGAPFERIFYSDNGSTAVESALKILLQYWQLKGEPKRTRFASLDQSYHGDTLGAVAIGHCSTFHHFFSSFKAVSIALPLPRSVDEVPAALDRAGALLHQNATELAGVVLEPLVLGVAGMVFYPREYLVGLLQIARSLGLPVVSDEVFTGFGRTGDFFTFDRLPIKPDLACLSKGLTAGMMPLGVTAVSHALYEPFRGGPDSTFFHGHTYTANPLSCAVAVESLRIFDEERVLERNAKLAACMKAEGAACAFSAHVREVRQLGMIWVAELTQDKATGTPPEPLNKPGWRIAQALWDKGFWIRPLHQMIYLLPPYCTTEAEIRAFFKALQVELGKEEHFAQ